MSEETSDSNIDEVITDAEQVHGTEGVVEGTDAVKGGELEGSPNFEAEYLFEDGEIYPLGSIIEAAALDFTAEEWNALGQEARDARIQAVITLNSAPEEVEEIEEVPPVYSKSFPAGTFPGDNLEAQRSLAKEAGSHLLARGAWISSCTTQDDGTIIQYITEKVKE